jgi:surface antigen
MKKVIATLCLSSLLFSGCAQNVYDTTNKASVGTVGGALGGAIIGSQFAGSGQGKLFAGLVGATIGGVIGNKVGARLDAISQQRMHQTLNYALMKGSVGRQYSWNTERANGYVILQREYETRRGYCREFSQVINIGGRPARAFGTACRQPDGQWRIMG